MPAGLCRPTACSGKGQPHKQPSEQPQRVVANTNVSLRKQLFWAKRATAPVKEPVEARKTKFRRQKPTDEEIAAAAQQEQTELQQLANRPRGPSLRSLYGSKNSPNPPIILVDGYNVYWQWRKDGEDSRAAGPALAGAAADAAAAEAAAEAEARMFEAARGKLLSELAQYSAWRNIKVMVVFDASGSLETLTTTREMFCNQIELVWAYETDADQFIIAEARILRALGAPKVLVASNDREVATSCHGNEIFPVSSKILLEDMRKTEKESHTQQVALTRKAKPSLGEAIFTPKNPVFGTLQYKRTPRWGQ